MAVLLLLLLFFYHHATLLCTFTCVMLHTRHYVVPRGAIYFNEIWRFVKNSVRSKPASSMCIIHPRVLTEYFLDLVPKNPHTHNLDCVAVYYVRTDYYASETSVFDTFLSMWYYIILCTNHLWIYRMHTSIIMRLIRLLLVASQIAIFKW